MPAVLALLIRHFCSEVHLGFAVLGMQGQWEEE